MSQANKDAKCIVGFIVELSVENLINFLLLVLSPIKLGKPLKCENSYMQKKKTPTHLAGVTGAKQLTNLRLLYVDGIGADVMKSRTRRVLNK